MKNVEIFINSLLIMNERKLEGLGKSNIVKEIEESDITSIHKGGLMYYLRDIEDDRASIDKALKRYLKEITKDHNHFSKVALFEKVSYGIFRDAYIKVLGYCDEDEEEIKAIYDSIKLPKRSTRGSAGHDFFTPVDIYIKPGETALIPTGIRCCMLENWVLKIYPRSGLGFKHRLQLDNTVGVIDSDYYNSDNEGHIMIKITNDTKVSTELVYLSLEYNSNVALEECSDTLSSKMLHIDMGKAFAQGIFSEYGITFDDDADGIRNGGFGSTDK